MESMLALTLTLSLFLTSCASITPLGSSRKSVTDDRAMEGRDLSNTADLGELEDNKIVLDTNVDTAISSKDGHEETSK